MSKFQLILLIVFGLFIVVAVGLFSISRGGRGSATATVSVWGDISSADFYALLSATGINQDPSLNITYTEKNILNIERDFTEALAVGTGPDIIILPLEKLWKNRSKLTVIPYANISERDFKSIFVEEGELFLSPEGVYALPLTLDPLVLYYNRDHLTRAGMPQPIAYWDELYSASTKLTVRDGAGNITKSVMALGEARNIPHAKDILSLLFLQAGSSITQSVGGELRATLAGTYNLPVAPADASLDFFTQFSNPARAYYSWNRSLSPAQTHFASGDSTYYIGYASELRELRAKNPTLNFGITTVPQSRVSERVITFGQMKGLAISRGSKNVGSSLAAILRLAGKESSRALSEILLLPPPRRDLLSEKPTDAILSVFYDAGLQSRGWIDPDDTGTKTVWHEMIESVTSGRARTSEATSRAERELQALIR